MSDLPTASSNGPNSTERVSDARVALLLKRYGQLIGTEVSEPRPGVLEINLPQSERVFFNSQQQKYLDLGTLRIALDPSLRDDEPELELAVIGSPFVDQLINAIRVHGNRLRFGLLPTTLGMSVDAAPLDVEIEDAQLSSPKISLSVHPIGRLVARVLMRAGASVDETLVDSSIFDLSAGRMVGSRVAAFCEAAAKGAAPLAIPVDASVREARPIATLLPLMLEDLEERLSPEFERRRTEAQKSLGVELARIGTYYQSLLDGPAGPGTDIADAESRSAFEAEHARRRDEEIRRHDLKATMQPVQLVEWGLLVQDAEWTLSTPHEGRGTVGATRPLTGDGAWVITCPSCGAVPKRLRVCCENHVCCEACSSSCTVCRRFSCRQHAPEDCHIDQGPVCGDHAKTCLICRQTCCPSHQAFCNDGAHRICSKCETACAICVKRLCVAHVTMSALTAPNGSRPLCDDHVLLCEGGTNEPVGVDEVVRCTSCDRHVCGTHQSICAVDKSVHCSSHLRRTDGSRRLVCTSHQASCAYEPNAVLALDEVSECRTCGSRACHVHVGTCFHDNAIHCRTHLAEVVDRPGQVACEEHRGHCQLDGRPFSLASISACPVCSRLTCREHLALCRYCARPVCLRDLDPASGNCNTCRRLISTTTLSAEILDASTLAHGSAIPIGAKWRVATDAAYSVVDVDLGWSRHLVFSVEHGHREPYSVMTHNLLGSKRRN